MKERIREKIQEHIEKILSKDELSFEEYQILSNEAYRLEMEEKNKELEAANDRRTEALKSSLEAMIIK